MLLEKLLMKSLKPYLSFRTRSGLIAKYLEGKEIKANPDSQTINLSRIRVAATQMPLYLVENPLPWVELLHAQVEKAARAGSQLIVFPENITLPLLGLIPGIKRLASRQLIEKTPASKHHQDSLAIGELFGLLGSAMETLYLETMSLLAKAYQIHIMGGSRLVPNEKGEVVNIASLFGPKGELIGSQAKAHLLPMETQWGICRGNGLQVFETALGKLAFPICMDATYFETFRILSLLGADLIIIPIANPEEYQPWKALRGIWPRVQESHVYGVKSALVGKNFFGLNFTGRAGVFAPLEAHGRNGVMALADNPHDADLVIADLDILRLRETKRNRLYGGDQNFALYRRYFPDIY